MNTNMQVDRIQAGTDRDAASKDERIELVDELDTESDVAL